MKRSLLFFCFLMLFIPCTVFAASTTKIPICKYEMTVKNSNSKREFAIYYNYRNGYDTKLDLVYREENGKVGTKGPTVYSSLYSTKSSPNVYLYANVNNVFYCPSYGILDVVARNEICLADDSSKCSKYLNAEIENTSKTYDLVEKAVNEYFQSIENISSTYFANGMDGIKQAFEDSYKTVQSNYFAYEIPNDFTYLFNKKINDRDNTAVINSIINNVQNYKDECESNYNDGLIDQDTYDKCMTLEATEMAINAAFKSVSSTSSAIVTTQTCESLLGDPYAEGDPAFYLRIAFNVIKYIAIIVLIVATVIDFITATAQSNEDALKKAINKAIIRLVLCVVIFLLPTLITFILKYLNDRAIDLCGIEG